MNPHLCQCLILLLAIALPTISLANEKKEYDQNFGISLLHEERYAESEAYFEQYLEGNAVAHYGFALSKFRKNPSNLTVEDTKEISAIYEKAIALSPSFSDAYFMCAVAYAATARLQLAALKKTNKNMPEHLNEPYAMLDKASAYLDKTLLLDPTFINMVNQERARVERIKIELNDFSGQKNPSSE